MLTKKLESALNMQVALEQESSLFYLSMASWSEVQGYHGITRFLYLQSDKKRNRMLKLFRYVNEKGGQALVPVGSRLPNAFQSVQDIFEQVLKHEIKISSAINKLVGECLDGKDFTTHNFLQWNVAEQMQEEKTARTLLDKLSLIGHDKGGMYLFDRDLGAVSTGNGNQKKTPLQPEEVF